MGEGGGMSILIEKTEEQREDENSVGMEYTKEQTCLDCKHCNQCYKQRHQGSNKACDDIELIEW